MKKEIGAVSGGSGGEEISSEDPMDLRTYSSAGEPFTSSLLEVQMKNRLQRSSSGLPSKPTIIIDSIDCDVELPKSLKISQDSGE